MAGVLNYKRYLNTLQTLTEVGNIFPGDQKTYTFTVGGSTSTSTQGWTATVSWETLVIDQMVYDKNNRPDFTGSKVLGIYTGTTISQYTTGTILVPANMYTGPILPAHTVNVPVTVVNVAWTKDGDIFANNIAYIQNWEPGVVINDPATGEGYEPVVSEPSTLILTGPGGIVYQRSIELKAQTDIPLYLGTTTRCYFYWDKAGGRVLLGIAYFDPNTNIATLNYNTSSTEFTGGTYPIYAEFSGFRQYGFAQSNTLQQVVISHIPLIVNAESISPVQSTYLIGDNVAYSLTVIPDPSYPQTGVPVSNDVRIFRRNTGTFTSANVILSTTTFVNGIVGVTQSVTTQLFNLTDTDGYYGNDSVSLSTSTLTANTFTATLSVKNYWNFDTRWDAYLDGPYGAGSRVSAQYTTEYLPVKTITGEAYPLTLTQDVSTSFLTEYTTFRVSKPGRFHGGTIKLMGRKGIDAFAEVGSFTNQSGNQTSETATIDTLTTGTWTLYASFAGDLGTSYYNAYKNFASTSNTVTHVITLGQDLPVFFTYQRTTEYDIVRTVATYNFSDTRQMPKSVTFEQGGTTIATSTWVRSTSTSISYTTSTLYESSTAYLDSFSDLQGGFQNPNKYTLFAGYGGGSTSTYLANPLERRVNVPAQYYAARGYTIDGYTTINAGLVGSYNVIALQREIENSFPRVLTVNFTSGPWYAIVTTEISITLTSYIGQYGSKYLYRIQIPLPVLSTRYGTQQSTRTADYYGFGLPTRALGAQIGQLYLMIDYGYLYERTSSDRSLPWSIYTINRFGYREYMSEWWNPKPITSGPYSNGGLWQTTGWSYIGEDGEMAADYNNGQAFGIKYWSAANPSNATEVANAEYYNSLYTALQQKSLAVVTTATLETPTIFTVYSGQHVAEARLPIGTVYNADILTASWPGTLDLDRSYGKFNSFNIAPTLAPSETQILPLTMATVDAHINPFRAALPDSPYWANPTVISTTETSYIYSTNPVNLKVLVTVDNGGYPGQDSGTVTFYRVDTNQDIGTASVTSGTATLSITADNIPGVGIGVTTSTTIGARFNGVLSADSTATNFITATVVRSALDMIPYQFSRYWKNELGQDVTEFDYTIPVVPYIAPTIVKTISRSDYPGFQTPGRLVSISGSYFDVEHPMTSFRGICSAYDNQDIYGQALNKSGYWDRTSSYYFVFKYTIVGGAYNGQVGWITPPQFPDQFNYIMSYVRSDGSPNAGPGTARYTMKNIQALTSGNASGNFVVGNFGFSKLYWTDDWTRIDIDVSVVGTSYYNHGVASMSSGVKLGITGGWNIT